jgi:hypothetical protein
MPHDTGTTAVWDECYILINCPIKQLSHIGVSSGIGDSIWERLYPAATGGNPIWKALTTGVTDALFLIGGDQRVIWQTGFGYGLDDLFQRCIVR